MTMASNTRLREQQGFTLVELMVVVAIIGILAAIGIPQLTKFVRRAQTTEATTVMPDIVRNIQAFVDSNPSVDAAALNTALGGGSTVKTASRACQTTPTDGCINFVASQVVIPQNSKWFYEVNVKVGDGSGGSSDKLVYACVQAFPADNAGAKVATNGSIFYANQAPTSTALVAGWENGFNRASYIAGTTTAPSAAYGSCLANGNAQIPTTTP